MSFQMGIGSLGGTVFSGGTLYPSTNSMTTVVYAMFIC